MRLTLKQPQLPVPARGHEARVVVARRLAASPQQVWDMLYDPAASRLMDSSVVRAGRLDDSVRGVGEIQLFVFRAPGTTELRTAAIIVEEFDPPLHVVHSSLVPAVGAAASVERTSIDLAPASVEELGAPGVVTDVRYSIASHAPTGAIFDDVDSLCNAFQRSIDNLFRGLEEALSRPADTD